MMIDAVARIRSIPAAANTSAAAPGDQAPGVVAQVSTLAAQLAFAAADAAARAVPGEDLAAKAARAWDAICGLGYTANKDAADAEVPATKDPELLARARQATRFVNDDTGVANPFAGLSRDQLATIEYDESGTFTINERRAAHKESYRVEFAYRQALVAKIEEEYARTGKLTESFKDLLAHLGELPPIEKTEYPEHYTEELLVKIALDLRYR